MSQYELAALMGNKSETDFILFEVLAKWAFDIEAAAALPIKGYTRWISPDGKYKIGIHFNGDSLDIFAFENVATNKMIGVFRGKTKTF